MRKRSSSASVLSATACTHPESQQKPLFSARDYIGGDLFVLRQCLACDLVRTTPQPSPDELGRYYPHGYYGRGKRYSTVLERVLDWLYAFRALCIHKANGGQPGRVLDIGCGRGLLLHQLRKRGWQVTGTELSDDSAGYARDVLQIDVQTGSVAELGLPANTFDAVILWHVLEHVSEPADLLHEVARILRPGGTLLLAVPNFGSLEARWARARWFHLDVPRHLSHFTFETVHAMLQAEGLRPRMVSYFALEYDFFSFVQTTLNMLGLRHNMLYNLLRARGAKVLTQERRQLIHPYDVAVTLVLTPVLGAISLVWAPLVALLSRGATVTIYASKLAAGPRHG